MSYQRVKDWHTAQGCGIREAVRVEHSGVAWNRSALMTCQMATSLWEFETRIVQPAAQRHFGRPVRTMLNAGSYDCRGIRGRHPERLSEHASGRAIDITGFVLEDGTVVSVLRNWHGKGPKAEFLHEVADGACGIFSVVINPDGNALHRDHFHLDIGPHKYCKRISG